ncbi:MAG: ferric reductase-like transmembrane domain-containing protein [Pseudomonadota bacterium]
MTSGILALIGSRYIIWIALSIPAIPFVAEFIWPDRYYPEMMHRSGELSVQLLVLTLAITPISMILKNWKSVSGFGLWLLRNRRYFGLASFSYAAIHTLLYLRQIGFDWGLAWLEALDLPFGSGWIAMLAMIPLALTSNNWSVRKLGRKWKPLQRFSYLIAAATFLHWLLLDFFLEDVLFWIALLVVAKVVQIAPNFRVLAFQVNKSAQ